MANEALKNIFRTRKALRVSNSDQRGFSLVELLISLALMGILGVALVQGLSAVARGQGIHDERVGAIVAARSQLESVKQVAYDNSVTIFPGPGYTALPAQITVGNIVYDMQIIAQEIDVGVQLITVVVSNGGQEINRLQAYKADR